MNTFVLHLQGATQYERVEGVTSFVGRDASGSFGILAAHQRIMTILEFGLARFRIGEGTWQFLAVPGGVLYFVADELFLSTRRYVRETDYVHVTHVLDEQLRAEESGLRSVKDSLRRLEEEMFKRLWRMGRGGEAVT
jgi:F-type H+-transporting ATPase subunit epsilon